MFNLWRLRMEKEVKKAKKKLKKVVTKDKVGSEKEVLKKKVDPIKDAFIAAQNRYKDTIEHLQAIDRNNALLRANVYESMVNKDYVTLNFKSEKAMYIAQAKEAGVSRQALSDAKICAAIEIDNAMKHGLWSANALLEFRKYALPEDYAKLIPMVNKLCANEGQKQVNLRMVMQVTDEYYNRHPDPKPVAKSSKAKPIQLAQTTLKTNDDKRQNLPSAKSAKDSDRKSEEMPVVKKAKRPVKLEVNKAKGVKSTENGQLTGQVIEIDKKQKVRNLLKLANRKLESAKMIKVSHALQVSLDKDMKLVCDAILNDPDLDEADYKMLAREMIKIAKEDMAKEKEHSA